MSNHYETLYQIIESLSKLDQPVQDALMKKITSTYQNIQKLRNEKNNELIKAGKEFWNAINSINDKIKFDLEHEASEFLQPYQVQENALVCMLEFHYKRNKFKTESETFKLIEETHENLIIEAYHEW